ncbi:E3 ubiquitin-protein ligase CCNB1IP1-like [Petromyzon marinus]|uniref:E3 ubiquitin-protein ligase CCNB1IP1-like n=1 Tax=Petromyzon marinus TaxID=7757 RepID=UPI003F6F7509
MSAHEEILVCNLRKCRRIVGDFAWVTSCSHLFCDEDGEREFKMGAVACPACGALPRGSLDVVRVCLNPPEEHKSMVLAGLGPDVIQEICSRALSFWIFQMHQERLYQEHLAAKSKRLRVQSEDRFKQEIQNKVTEVATLKRQFSLAKSELAKFKKRYNEAAEKLLERDREQKKLQVSYDRLRLRSYAIDEGRRAEEEEAPNGAASSPFIVRFAATSTPRTSQDAEGNAWSWMMTTPPRCRPGETEFAPRPLFFNGSPPGRSPQSDGFLRFPFPAKAAVTGARK